MPEHPLRTLLIDALLKTDFIASYDWVGTGSSHPTDDQIRAELGEMADQLVNDPYLDIHVHICAACRWEKGFGAGKPLEHTCAARKGQPTVQEIEDPLPGPRWCRATWTSPALGQVRCCYEEGHLGWHKPWPNAATFIAVSADGSLQDVMGAYWLPEDGS